MNTQNDVTQRRAQPGVALWRWVRALHAWIMGIGWTDLGVAFALVSIGADSIGDGFVWHGLWCWMLGITIYVRAPRPNATMSQPGGQS